MKEAAHLSRDWQVLSDEAVMAVVCANGDRCAFSALVERWEPRIFRLCLRVTGNTQDAEDATQER